MNKSCQPDNLKAGIVSLKGFSFDHVKGHDNSAQLAQHNALAYVQGNDIHVPPGQEEIPPYNP